MIQTKPFEQHPDQYDNWYEQYPTVYQSELLAIRELMLPLGENLTGIEVGLGTGRFAEPLGIKEGIEPAEEMRKMAVRRGIEVMNARAEKLPYRALHFDFVLFVTICHLDKLPAALREAHRVLKRKGALLIGFLPEDQPIAQEYQENRERSNFYRHATFYTPERVEQLLTEAGFKDFKYTQTLFGKLDEIEEVQSPRPGYGEGSFVVVSARKK